MSPPTVNSRSGFFASAALMAASLVSIIRCDHRHPFAAVLGPRHHHQQVARFGERDRGVAHGRPFFFVSGPDFLGAVFRVDRLHRVPDDVGAGIDDGLHQQLVVGERLEGRRLGAAATGDAGRGRREREGTQGAWPQCYQKRPDPRTPVTLQSDRRTANAEPAEARRETRRHAAIASTGSNHRDTEARRSGAHAADDNASRIAAQRPTPRTKNGGTQAITIVLVFLSLFMAWSPACGDVRRVQLVSLCLCGLDLLRASS